MIKPLPEHEIDWEKVKGRLAKATAATDAILELSPRQAADIMDQRARELAQVPSAAPADMIEVLRFTLADERYAVETRTVREVFRPTGITPMPGAPGFVLGVANLRGEVLAVMDLGKILEIDKSASGERPWVLVLGTDKVEFGVAVEGLEEVTTLRAGKILPPAALAPSAGRRFVRGVTGDALIVLDGNALIADELLVVDQED